MSRPTAERDYQAIDPQDKTRRESVELRLKDGRTYWLKHSDRHLMALSPDQKALTIFFYSMSVVIWGRNLREVATAIDGRNTPWIQQFDPARWDMPAVDSGAVFVENMELYQPKQDDGPEDGPCASASKPTSGTALN